MQVGTCNIGNYFDKLYVMNSEQMKIYNLRMYKFSLSF